MKKVAIADARHLRAAIPVPPEIMDAILEGSALSVIHGPIFPLGDNRYERMVSLCLDGESVAEVLIQWISVETLRSRVTRWLFGASAPEPDMRIKLDGLK